MATIGCSEADYQARIDRLTSSVLMTLGNGLTYIGALSLDQKSSVSTKKMIMDQRNLSRSVQKADEFERTKAVEASIEIIFSSLKALLGDDLLGILATDEDGDKRGRVVAARRIVTAIRKAIDTDPTAPPSPLAQLDDGLRALLAGETTDILKTGERAGKYRNGHSVRRIQYMAVSLREKLIATGLTATDASTKFHGSFGWEWDTARKWKENYSDLISPYDVKIWDQQLSAMIDQACDPVAAIMDGLTALGKAYVDELRRM